jgi:tRNA-2-methylthio-N6-dimethylallyladenosine synthase
MTPKRYFLETMGCQMNVLDSELVAGQLRAQGYEPAGHARDADVVLINTCSVRGHAEDKVYSRLGELGRIKRRRPEIIIGVIGCMAERDGDNLLARCRHVDLLCGPGQLARIPALITEALEKHTRPVALAESQSRKLSPEERSLALYDLETLDVSRPIPQDGSVLQSYIRVQRGCDKFCTFCVVPFTRGPEVSRPPANIVEEARRLAGAGAREVTLLGQTVNSYAYQENGRTVRFAELLQRVHDVPGIERLRFVTSYPGDFTDDVLAAMRDLPNLCEYLHIPAQSGSNAVLQRMKRQYTIERYVDLIDRARALVPGIALAGDFIVGFSGETDAEFEQTVALMERVRYQNCFIFRYSPRPGTAADRKLPDDVAIDVKGRRNTRLLQVQDRISREDNARMVGQIVEVLVEGFSKAAIKAQEAEQTRGQEVGWRKSDQLTGRTRGDQVVVFDGPESLIGRLIKVQITAATALTLHGNVVQN